MPPRTLHRGSYQFIGAQLVYLSLFFPRYIIHCVEPFFPPLNISTREEPPSSTATNPNSYQWNRHDICRKPNAPQQKSRKLDTERTGNEIHISHASNPLVTTHTHAAQRIHLSHGLKCQKKVCHVCGQTYEHVCMWCPKMLPDF